MQYERDNFDEMLKENLILYSTFSEDIEDANIFNTTREIAIARFALNSQAKAYARAVEILTSMLDSLNGSEASQLSSIMIAIQTIENKSKQLIESVRAVTALLGEIVNIDVDKAALRQMLINLPSLVEDTITTISDDPNLATRISTSLSNRIDSMMVAFRFNDVTPTQSQRENNISDGLLLQYSNLINSVPTSEVAQ